MSGKINRYTKANIKQIFNMNFEYKMYHNVNILENNEINDKFMVRLNNSKYIEVF